MLHRAPARLVRPASPGTGSSNAAAHLQASVLPARSASPVAKSRVMGGGTDEGCVRCSECNAEEYAVQSETSCKGFNGDQTCAKCASMATECKKDEFLNGCGNGEEGKCVACSTTFSPSTGRLRALNRSGKVTWHHECAAGEFNHQQYFKGCGRMNAAQIVNCKECPGICGG